MPWKGMGSLRRATGERKTKRIKAVSWGFLLFPSESYMLLHPPP